MNELNPYAAPQSDGAALSQQAGLAPGVVCDDGVWCDGELLVVRKGAVLPDRCVKCNRPAHGGRVRCWLLNLHPSFILFLSPGLPIFIPLYIAWALIKRRLAYVEVGICEVHQRKRQARIVNGCTFVVAGLALLFLIGLLSGQGPASGFALISTLPALGLLGAGAVSLVRAVRQVASEKIEDGYVWLKHVDPAFLDELPNF